MDDILLLLRLVIALVFFVAGITKLLDLEATADAVEQFGAPKGGIGYLSVALPITELVTAALLLVATTAWIGALASLGLLAIFTSAIGINLARGKQPDCHCFGQLQSKPISYKTVIRNLILIGLTAVLVAQGQGNTGPSISHWFRSLTLVETVAVFTGIVLIAFLAFESWMLLHLFRQNGRLMLRMDALEAAQGGGLIPRTEMVAAHHNGPALGSMAPTFELPDLKENQVSLSNLLERGKSLMLIFSDPGCGPCNALLPDIARWQTDHGNRLSIALISRGTVEENESKSVEFGISNILLQTDREVAIAYEAHGTPMAVILNPDGTIGSSVVGGSEVIAGLVGNAVGVPNVIPHQNGHNGNGHHHAPPMPAWVKIGDPAPQFELPDLDGNLVRLEDFKGKETLLLFWNPGCGFCTQMLDELKSWEANKPEDAPELVVISTGDRETNVAQGFQSTVVLDSFTIALMYGGTGTPSGILIDSNGRVYSDLAIGSQALFSLVGMERRIAKQS